MPPHCDAMDGPVVRAALKALDAGDVKLILPYVHRDGEAEVVQAFEKVLPLRSDGESAKELADLYFFETVVRVHRAGEGASYTGLKPAGLDVGPVIPVAEKAIESGSPSELSDLLSRIVQDEVEERFERLMHLKQHANETGNTAREYVSAMLGLQVWSHRVFSTATGSAHEEAPAHQA
jgi:hypothetical protein